MSRTAIAMLLAVGLASSPALAAPRGAHAVSSAVQNDAVPNASGNLTYRGGPVLQNVKVFTVYWGNNVQFSGTGTQSLDAFYKAVIASPYYDWLNEYNTPSPSQKFGRGTFAGSYAYTNGATGTLQDSSIQTAIGSLIDSGKLPAPDANTLFAIHFAPGINIKMSDGSASCSVFCAYHSSFSHGGKNVYYAINPDQGGSCAGGCGSNASLFNNTTSVASHELVEATTDPNVGGNSDSDLGWYDDSQGEIGDICNASQCKVSSGGTATTTTCPTTYVLQNEWSNKKGACIAQDPTLVVNDFSVATTPAATMTINVPQGGMTTVMVALTKTAGASETVNFTATAPTDVTGTFSPTSAMSMGGTSTLTIAAKATAMIGMGKVTISASGSSTHTVDLNINVTSPPDMAMSPDLAEPSGGGNGGNGGGGNGGGGSGGTGTGGNGNGNNGGGGGDSGCSMSGGSIAGSWAFAGILLFALAFRRRRA